MIISHRYRYLFIENPLTASWAIRRELCEFYGGEPILHKHATYPEFRKIASRDEQRYFVFITVRNPLDVLVSRYLKYKHDHEGAFSDPNAVNENLADYSDRIKYDFIRETNSPYPVYFLKFYRRPYSDLADISSSRLDFVIHYEQLQEDFTRLLDKLGIEPVRPIPIVNRTSGKKGDWVSYYTPEILPRARQVCGPFIEKWGYSFPDGWGEYRESLISRWKFRWVSGVKNAYIHHFRNNNRPYARLVRRLRAHLLG